MRLKRLQRFTAALTGFLLIALSFAVLPVRAEDSPSLGGVETDTSVVDFGSVAETDITSTTKRTFSVTNGTGERLTFSKVLYKNSEGSFAESAYDSQSRCYDGNHFYLYGPAYLDASGSLVTQTYIVQPFSSGDKRLTARDEPYTDDFQLVFTDSQNHEYTAEVSVSLMVVQEGQHLIRVTAVNGHIYAYMSETIYSDDASLNAVGLDDFEITATDEGEQNVDLPGLRVESHNISNNSVVFAFNSLQSDVAKVINVSVKHKEDSTPKTTQFEVEGASIESNIPENGTVVIKVTDNDTKEPVSGAPVSFRFSGGYCYN